jgi:hypothetical protein
MRRDCFADIGDHHCLIFFFFFFKIFRTEQFQQYINIIQKSVKNRTTGTITSGFHWKNMESWIGYEYIYPIVALVSWCGGLDMFYCTSLVINKNHVQKI